MFNACRLPTVTLWVLPRFAAVPVQQRSLESQHLYARRRCARELTLTCDRLQPRRPCSNETACRRPCFFGLCASAVATTIAAKLPLYVCARCRLFYVHQYASGVNNSVSTRGRASKSCSTAGVESGRLKADTPVEHSTRLREANDSWSAIKRRLKGAGFSCAWRPTVERPKQEVAGHGLRPLVLAPYQ